MNVPQPFDALLDGEGGREDGGGRQVQVRVLLQTDHRVGAESREEGEESIDVLYKVGRPDVTDVARRVTGFFAAGSGRVELHQTSVLKVVR